MNREYFLVAVPTMSRETITYFAVIVILWTYMLLVVHTKHTRLSPNRLRWNSSVEAVKVRSWNPFLGHRDKDKGRVNRICSYLRPEEMFQRGGRWMCGAAAKGA